MSNPQDRINIQLDISASNPQVLQGLDALFRLGLLSHEQVRQLCQQHLVSPLPALPVTEAVAEPERDFDRRGLETKPLPSQPTPPTPVKAQAAPRPSYIGEAVRSLMAELSVQWLLFLGVFMVTLSSGVLAATRWQQFPPFGQYLVLFAYSCLFWFVSQWAVKQSNLQLTAQTLQTATMLLVSLNFWAMDGFGLWQSPLGWITAAIAAFVLTRITLNTYQNTKQAARSSPLPWFNYIFVSFLHWGWALPVFPLIAVYLGTIASSVTTFYQTKYLVNLEEEPPGEDPPMAAPLIPPFPPFERGGQRNKYLVVRGINLLLDRPDEERSPRDRPYGSAYLLVLYATAVILFRGIFLQGIEITQLGLAIGISGWLFVWLSEKKEKEPDAADGKTIPPSPQLPLTQIGNVLLLAGWCISFFAIPWENNTWQPWEALQAIGVSGLALWLLLRRFLVGFQRNNLITIFFIGLQACILLRQVIPPGFRSQAVKTGVELAQAADAPFTIYAITLIPYLILTVWFTDWIYRQEKSHAWNCGLTGDCLSLGLAVTMASLSLANVNVRSLNLLATTIILAAIAYRRLTTGIGLPDTGDRRDYTFPPETTATSLTLVYLTHIGSLLTVASFIDKFFPNLPIEIWGAICLAVMVGEWQLYFWAENLWAKLWAKLWAETVNEPATETPANQAKTKSQSSPDRSKIYLAYFSQQSSYYLGLSLAALSYYLFTETQLLYGYKDRITASIWGLVWLMTPIALTDIAKWSINKRTMAGWLSTIALIMANSITLEMPMTRLIGFGVAAVLMFVNTRYLRRTGAAAIALGFSLSFTAILLDFGIFGLPRVSGSGWLIVAALTVAVLVGLYKWLTAKIAKKIQETETTLSDVYTPAVKGWAIFLATFLLIILTLHSLLLYLGSGSILFSFAPNANALIATIIVTGAIGYWNFPVFQNRSIYALAWCLEIIAAETLAFFDGNLLILAVANITLGLTTQLLGDWYYSRRHSTVEIIPRSWDIIPLAYAVLGASLRSGTLTSWTGLTTLGLAFTAIGVGRRSPQGKLLIYLAFIGVWAAAYEGLYYQIYDLGTGDQLVAIAALTTGILYAYRILNPWLTYYLKLTQEELMIAAHIHWVVGSSVLIAAIAYPISVNMLLGIGTGVLLARYAIMQGRHNPYLNLAETWVYLGLLETAALLAYGLTRLPDFWFNWVISWAGAIATLIAYFFYFIPWDKWGWPLQPWRRSAIILPITTAFIFGGNLLSTTFVPSSLLMPAGFYIFLAWFHRRSVNAWRFTYLSGVLIDWAIIRWLNQLNVSEPLWYVIPISLLVLYIAQVDPDLKKAEAKKSRHTIRVLASGTICVVSLLTANWLITGLFSLVAIFAGLILRVRAYLYVGTVVFLLDAIYQMVILIYEDTQLKWAIGLLVGIAFIWIAATFERSRQQIVALVQQAIAELETWE